MQPNKNSAGDRYMQLLNIAETLESEEAIAAFLIAKRLIAKDGQTLRGLMLPIEDWPVIDDENDASRLVKILSLTDSDKEGESIAAFLMARNIMKRCGLCFQHVLVAPKQGSESTEQHYYPLIDLEMRSLQNRIRYLHQKLAEQECELKQYRDAFNDLMDASWAMHSVITPKQTPPATPLLN